MIIETPCFAYVVGHTGSGKTFMCNEIARVALKNKYKIVYIVRSDFNLEKDVETLVDKNENVFLIQTSALSKQVFDYLISCFQTDSKKIVFIDNFTYQMDKNLLNLITFFRKYNASIFFLAHTLQPHKDISPRLKESFSYLMLFWVPTSIEFKNQNEDAVKKTKTQRNATQSFLGESMYNLYKEQVKPKSYKFLMINFMEGSFMFSKLPDFEIKFRNIEQHQTIRKNKSKDKLSFEKNVF